MTCDPRGSVATTRAWPPPAGIISTWLLLRGASGLPRLKASVFPSGDQTGPVLACTRNFSRIRPLGVITWIVPSRESATARRDESGDHAGGDCQESSLKG